MLHSPGVASSSVCVLGGVQPCVGVLDVTLLPPMYASKGTHIPRPIYASVN